MSENKKLKKGHFWGYVWSDNKEEKKKRIIVDTFSEGCSAALHENEEDYFLNKHYWRLCYKNYEKIEEPNETVINPEYKCFSLCSKETRRLLTEQMGKGTLEYWDDCRWVISYGEILRDDITYRAIIKPKTPMDEFMEKFKDKKIFLKGWTRNMYIIAKEPSSHSDVVFIGTDNNGCFGKNMIENDWQLWEEPKRRLMKPVELAGKWVHVSEDKEIISVLAFTESKVTLLYGEYDIEELKKNGDSWCDTPDGEFSSDFTIEVE